MAAVKEQKRVFSGIQPSGVLHIGNYLGAIKQFVKLQYTHNAIFCVVDEHAITVPQKPQELRRNTLNTAMLYLASGIDPKEAIIFVQSQVPAHTELAWILNTITPLGELERMTQFKDKVQSQAKEAGVFAGLLNYPTLMAADILLYRTDAVPIGDDQKQHIELARSLAERFNNHFGNTFSMPEPLIEEDTARIMSLQDPTKKMSKSDDNTKSYIHLLDTPDDIRLKIKSAVTDSGKEIVYDRKKRPAISNLISIYRGYTKMTFKEIEDQYKEKTYADFKNDLAEVIIGELAPLQKRFQELSADKTGFEHILRDGARRAKSIADTTLQDVKQKMGFFI
ncbi:MAG: tryptophan--tRNA ligase [Candidatus Niyogibacteria bacterium]|nr:tryptophan--tRNA ligase [Candidatus Niyogibacteria bacterium]